MVLRQSEIILRLYKYGAWMVLEWKSHVNEPSLMHEKSHVTLFNIYVKNVIFMQLQYSDFRKYFIKYNYSN